MAGMVRDEFEKLDFEAEVKEVSDASMADLTAEHDLLLLGCPAYGDDEIELQEDFATFYEQMNGVELNEKPFAVFAPGDSSYEYFCGSFQSSPLEYILSLKYVYRENYSTFEAIMSFFYEIGDILDGLKRLNIRPFRTVNGDLMEKLPVCFVPVPP